MSVVDASDSKMRGGFHVDDNGSLVVDVQYYENAAPCTHRMLAANVLTKEEETNLVGLLRKAWTGGLAQKGYV